MKYKAIVLNLDSRKDRLSQVTEELNNQGIVFERFPAISHNIGWIGFNQSVIAVFEHYREVENLFIFEDDCYFEKQWNESVLGELPADYDALWLGSNLQSVHQNHYSKNLTRLENGWATHAVLYRRKFREWCLENWDGKLVFDEWLRVNAYHGRKCFVLNPMIAFQRTSVSDITGQVADYSTAWQISKNRLQ